MTKSNLEWVAGTLFQLRIICYTPSLKEVRAGALKQRPWKNAACCLAPNGILVLLYFSTQDHQPCGGTIHCELDLWERSSFKKIPPRLALQARLVAAFYKLRCLLPNDYFVLSWHDDTVDVHSVLLSVCYFSQGCEQKPEKNNLRRKWFVWVHGLNGYNKVK